MEFISFRFEDDELEISPVFVAPACSEIRFEAALEDSVFALEFVSFDDADELFSDCSEPKIALDTSSLLDFCDVANADLSSFFKIELDEPWFELESKFSVFVDNSFTLDDFLLSLVIASADSVKLF